jgi:hypothetical protein
MSKPNVLSPFFSIRCAKLTAALDMGSQDKSGKADFAANESLSRRHGEFLY